MSLSREESALLDKRDELNPVEREVVDTTMNELNRVARELGLHIKTDDSQCRVECALIRLVLESRP